MMRKVKFQEGGNVRGPTRDVSEWTDQELDAAIYAQETAETPSMERPAGPRLNVGPRARMSPPTGIYTLADLRNERRRRQPASRRYAPFEGQPGGEVTEEETRPAPRASAPANMPRYNQGPSAAEAIDRAANRARTPPPPAPSRGATAEMQTADVPGNRASTPSGPAAAARMREIDMQNADVPGNRGTSPAARPRPSARPAAAPAARPRSRMSEADRLNQMELDRIEQDRIDEARRGLREDADRRANRGFFERLGLRRTNETGMDPATLEHRRNYLGSGAADTNVSYNKKGGLLKAKAPMKKGGAVKKAPAKKMKSGGKVAPKKMMKGGMTSKPKKMMGGGKAMYAKGGVAKGCK